jgi:hypothetical protein
VKSLAVVTTLFLLVAGCSRALKNEAVEHVRKYCELTELGEAYFLCETRGTDFPIQIDKAERRWESPIVFELRNPRIEASSNSLSEAEKLNGVEWAGFVYIKADAFRRCPPQFAANSSSTWSSWLSDDNPNASFGGVYTGSTNARGHYTYQFTVTKIKGEWRVTPLHPEEPTGEPYYVNYKKVEPSDLPR